MEARISSAGAVGYGTLPVENRIAICPAADALSCGEWRFADSRNACSSSPLVSICAGGTRNTSFVRAFPSPNSSSCKSSASRRWMGVVCAAEREVYQPFRPPPSVVKIATPKEAATPEEQLEILRERRGFWHEYAGVLPALTRAGYTPAQIDEATGVTGVEQNMVVVASQVRLSLQTAGVDENLLSFFDVGGAELLYELRILSTDQRRAAAEFIVEKNMDPKAARELARAIKDFPRRKRDEGWKAFSSRPGDCLAFSFYRQSKELKTEAERESAINNGLAFASTESARTKLEEARRRDVEDSSESEELGKAQLPVVRLPSKEDASNSPLPIILPAANDLASLAEAPRVAAVGTGPFNVYNSLPSWKSWVAVPGWPAIVTGKAAVAVELLDVLPAKYNQRKNEPVLVVVDKGDVDLEQDAHFLVEVDGRLAVLAGYKASVSNRKALGRILLVLRPALAENEQIQEWEWE